MSVDVDAEELPFAVGAAGGAGAWALGYLFTYLLAGTEVRESPLNQFLEAFGDGGAVYEVVGWVFFNAHLVETVIDVGFFGSGARNFVGGEDGFTALLFLVPPLLLVAGGLAVGRAGGVTDTTRGAIAGALVTPGYLVGSVAGAVLFAVEVGGASGRPDPLVAVLVAGLLYPVVFGALGGTVAAVTAAES
jgi:hypothetical protein